MISIPFWLISMQWDHVRHMSAAGGTWDLIVAETCISNNMNNNGTKKKIYDPPNQCDGISLKSAGLYD
jgi:hypothetical protein